MREALKSIRPAWAAGIPGPALSVLYHYLIVLGAVALLASTWSVWQIEPIFPQVPFFAWGVDVPRQVDGFALTLLIGSLALLLVSLDGSPIARGGFCVAATAMLVLILLDQHRCQPWAYQWILTALVVAALPPQSAAGWLRALTVGLYFHSAWPKFDPAFAEGIGRNFLETALTLVGHSSRDWTPLARQIGASLFPTVELAVAVALLFPQRRLRWLAIAMASGMHLVTLLLLGPWGMNHQPGVLVWNLFCLLQVFLLFRPPAQESVQRAASVAAPFRYLPARTLILAALLWPFAAIWGGCDAWLAWRLYSPRRARLVFEIHESERFQLPAPLPRLLVSAGVQPWWIAPLDRWSLEATSVPIYPETRFELGLVGQLLDRSQIPDGQFRLREFTNDPAPVTPLTTRHQVEQFAARFWLNSRPRPVADEPPLPQGNGAIDGAQ